MASARKAAKRPARKVARKAGKTPSKTPSVAVVPAVMPGARGGTLLVGNPGNVGGPGRPPSIIREKLRGSYEQRLHILDAIADGEVMERVEVPLLSVLKHAECPKCGDALKPTGDEAELAMLTIRGTRSATASERIKSLDQMAKYGLGEAKEITVEEVKRRLLATVLAARDLFPAVLATDFEARLRRIWRGDAG